MTNEEFNDSFRKRTKEWAIDVLRLLNNLTQNPASRVITFQLGRCATSVGANYRAFCRGRSQKELFAKICIVVEEADESIYWLEIIHETGLHQSAALNRLIHEGTEILKITAKTKSSLHKILKGE